MSTRAGRAVEAQTTETATPAPSAIDDLVAGATTALDAYATVTQQDVDDIVEIAEPVGVICGVTP